MDTNWGQAGQGAMGGAAAGSFAGPWGMAIGAGIGGLMGLFGGGGQSDYQDQLKQLAAGYGNRQAPQGVAQTGQLSAFRKNQAGLISQLESMAAGNGPSAAAIQMREAMDRAAGAQASAAAGAGGRGVNAGAALRNAQNNTAAVQAQGARDTATLRAQEQMNATGMLGQVINQGRTSDEGMSQFNAQQNNQMTDANMQAVLNQLGLNDRSQLQALQQAMGGAGPGTGASVMAGGAQAFMPGLNYWQNKNNGMGNVQQPSAGGFGYYQRNPDGSSGPVTSPSQMG